MRKAKRLDNIPPYLFARIDKAKTAIIKSGADVIDLGVGDPDLPTPPHIVQALHKAIDDPKTLGYPPYEGTTAFKEAVAAWYKKRFDVDLDPKSEVLSLIGSKEGIAHVFTAMLDPGDYSLIPDPCYPVYKMATLLVDGIPYSLPLLEENGFLPDLKAIDEKVLKKAKLLFINYPGNPTGAVAHKGFLEYAVAFSREHDLLLCSDLAYSEVAYDGYKPMSVLEVPGARDVAIEFHSLSKTYNMTAHRIGMAVGSAQAIAALSVVKTNIDSGIYKAIQAAAVTALLGPQDSIAEQNAVYARRRDVAVEGLNSLGWKLEAPKASFYIWARIPRIYSTSSIFCQELLEKSHVLVVPGNGYGQAGEGYFRISITSPENRISEAIDRMKKARMTFE
ncbi:MAG: LL-diaminopimelate aminotransferase [Candidatus Margulisiibacteriota bacterium]|nr:LL-diaminopimelate aminotransferase [Candidatus Margulisiibacteriota bacterium]